MGRRSVLCLLTFKFATLAGIPMYCSGTDSGVIGRAAPVHEGHGWHLEVPRDGSSDA